LTRLRAAAARLATAALGKTTDSGYALNEARREVAWWVNARVAGIQSHSLRMLRGSGLCVSYGGYVELVPIDVPTPGAGQVTVRSEISAVNVGTERAQYLKLPNAARVEGRPLAGSIAGTVVALGPGVTGLEVGRRVAVGGAPHASIVTVPATSAVPLPEGVSFADGALVTHGIIAGQGLHLAELAPGTPFGVVGLGIIGAITLRLASAAGASPRAVVATSRSKAELAQNSGAEAFLTTRDDADAIAALALPVVFEVTGDPRALATAVDMAAPGGRVILLGSSRGITNEMPVGVIREKGLTLVGAHVDTLRREAESGGGAAHRSEEAERRAAQRFLDVLAAGEVRVDDVVTRVADPREAAILYREIVEDRSIVGAALDWSCLSDTERQARSSFLRPPSVTGRGVVFDERLARRVRRAGASRLEPCPDPMQGASGHLRFGMLGCGDISTHNAGAIAAAPNTDLVACFDPATTLAQDIADGFGAERVATAEALVSRPDVDAVLISVPHHLHEPLALLAIEAGKHVVVEKPLATDVRSASAIVDAARAAGVTLSTCFPQRYEAPVLLARHLIELGAIGELSGTHVRVLMDKPPAYWVGGYSGRAPSTWRSSRAQAGGGVLIMNSCHYVDMVRHLAGVEVSGVSALAGTVDGDMEVEDSISVALRYGNGAIGSIVASSAVRGTISNEVQLWGRDGHIVVEPRGRFYSLRSVGAGRTSRWQHFEGLPAINGRMAYVSRLATAIERGHEPDVSAQDGLVVQALIEAAYRSAQEGRLVDPSTLIGEQRAGAAGEADSNGASPAVAEVRG